MRLDTLTFDHEIWLTPGDGGGDGTQKNPFRTRSITKHAGYSKSLRMHLMPGEFHTAGLVAPPRFHLKGYDATVHLKSTPDERVSGPHACMIRSNGWSEVFAVEGVALDGSADRLIDQLEAAQPQHAGNVKVELVSVKTTVGFARGVKVRNFGSSAAAYLKLGVANNAGLEAFPLCLWTYAGGPPWFYPPAYSSLVWPKDQTYLEITDCDVTDGVFRGGGYCTAIFVRTNQVGAGDRMPVGTRTTTAALVAGNRVHDIADGIAYGCADSEAVEFIGNVATDVKCGFNFDTGVVDGLTLRANQFIRVNQGANLQGTALSGLVRRNNLIVLKEPYFNSILGSEEASYFYNLHPQRSHAPNPSDICSVAEPPALARVGAGSGEAYRCTLVGAW
jgi:hypothetical protein